MVNEPRGDWGMTMKGCEDCITVLGVILGVVLLVAAFAIIGCAKGNDDCQATINNLTKALEMARAGTTQTEAIATKTGELTSQAVAEPMISIYVHDFTLLKQEPVDQNWPLIIKFDDGRKMRVFVSPLAYRIISAQKVPPNGGFIINQYVTIDPNWHDPDGDLIEESLFKFSLDDYGPKKRPKRAEY